VFRGLSNSVIEGGVTEGNLLIPGWTYKIESLYMDLSHLNFTSPGAFSSVTDVFVMNMNSAVTTHSHFTDWILRAGGELSIPLI
jgi:hypothetical protein